MIVTRKRAIRPAGTTRARQDDRNSYESGLLRAVSSHGSHTRGRAARGASASLLKNAWRWKEVRLARRMEDGGDEPHRTGGRQRKRQEICRMFQGSGAAEVVAPAFLVDGSRCGGRRKERLASLRAAWPGAGLRPLMARDGWVLLCRSVRHHRLGGRFPGLVFQRRADDDVMTATRAGARRRNADERQTGKGEPEAASQSSHSGAASRSLQPLRLVRVDTLIGSDDSLD